MRRYHYPVAAMVIGLLLGPMAEAELLRSYQLGGGDLTYALLRPGAVLIAVGLVLVSIAPSAMAWWSARRRTVRQETG